MDKKFIDNKLALFSALEFVKLIFLAIISFIQTLVNHNFNFRNKLRYSCIMWCYWISIMCTNEIHYLVHKKENYLKILKDVI